jgi:hypothetical protein
MISSSLKPDFAAFRSKVGVVKTLCIGSMGYTALPYDLQLSTRVQSATPLR